MNSFADGCGFSIVIERACHIALVGEQNGKGEADPGQRLLRLRIVLAINGPDRCDGARLAVSIHGRGEVVVVFESETEVHVGGHQSRLIGKGAGSKHLNRTK